MPVWSRVILAATVSVGAIFAVFNYLDKEDFIIQDLQVELMSDRDPSSLFPEIKSDVLPKLVSFVGESIWSVDLEQVLAVVEKDRRIKDVRVSRRLPNKLKVYIEPHQALANILAKDGTQIFPLSREGSLFAPLPLTEASDAPILRGTHFIKDIKLRKLALGLLLELPQEGDFSLKSVSEIRYSAKDGLVLVLGLDDNEVIMGDRDFKTRIDHVRRVVQYLRSENLQGRVIDARFSKKVVVRLRNAS
jgi:cell division protein FtsQ